MIRTASDAVTRPLFNDLAGPDGDSGSTTATKGEKGQHGDTYRWPQQNLDIDEHCRRPANGFDIGSCRDAVLKGEARAEVGNLKVEIRRQPLHELIGRRTIARDERNSAPTDR